MNKLIRETKEKYTSKKTEEEEIEEVNVTSNIDGGAGPPQKPGVFSTKTTGSHNPEAQILGLKYAVKGNVHSKPFGEGISPYKKMMMELLKIEK